MSVEKTWDGQDQLDIPLQSRLGGKQKLVPWDLQPKSHLHCDINIKNRQKNHNQTKPPNNCFPMFLGHSSEEPLPPGTETSYVLLMFPSGIKLEVWLPKMQPPPDCSGYLLSKMQASTRKLNWGIHPMEWNVLPIPAFMPKQADLKPLSSDHKSTKILQLV